MPPSPTTSPWVLEIEDPASMHLELLTRPMSPPASEHDPPSVMVPITPVGGRRDCSTGLRVRADRARDWARVANRDNVEQPRHRGRPADVSWFLLARHALHPGARSWDRATVAVVSTCTVIGVWLGALAPPASPVSAPPTAGAHQSVP